MPLFIGKNNFSVPQGGIILEHPSAECLSWVANQLKFNRILEIAAETFRGKQFRNRRLSITEKFFKHFREAYSDLQGVLGSSTLIVFWSVYREQHWPNYSTVKLSDICL